jgi:hypothetical protein
MSQKIGLTGNKTFTTTAQHCSWAVLNNASKYITKAKDDIEDNSRLLLSVFDSLNKLCEKLSRLEYVLKRKNLEQDIPKGYKEKQNEN